MPAKADPDAQRKFYEDTEKPLMDRAKKGEVVVCSVSAAHFVMGNMLLGYIWCRFSRFLSTFTGRVHYYVLDVLNLVTKKMTTVTNDSYITATQVIELIDKLAHQLFLDNAKYQRCKLVQEYGICNSSIQFQFKPSLNVFGNS